MGISESLKDHQDSLKEEMDKAIEKGDGWLAHYYGSQYQHMVQIEEDGKRRLSENKRKLELLYEECQLNAQLRLEKAMIENAISEKKSKSFWQWVFSKLIRTSK